MIPALVSSILWTMLIATDIAIAIRLGRLYRQDSDKRKLMFICGLLLCSFAYFAAILGIDSFPLSRTIFEWCPLPIEFAFILSILNDRFKNNVGKFFNGFLIVMAATIGLFFVPLPPLTSTYVLITGMTFLIVLAIVQYVKDFDTPSVTLVLSIPSFAVCFTAIGQNMTELAIFAGFMAKIFLMFSFELARKQSGNLSSVFALKKLGNAIENFDTLFHLLPDPAIILDINGNFLETSLSFVKLTGLKKMDIVGANIFTQNFLSAESKAKLEKNLTLRLRGQQIAPYQIDILSKEKKTFQFEVNATRIEYKNVPAEIVVFRDLTERNRLLEFTSLLFEFAPDPYYLSDLRGNFLDGNKAAQEMVGYDKKELIGKSFLDLKILQKRQIPKAAKLLALNRLGKRTGPDEFVLNRKDGTQSSVEISTFPLKIREQTVVLGIARDVTERNRAENAIRESEEKFRNIFEKAHDGLLLLGLDGKVVDLNPKAAKVFSLNKQIAIGKSLTELGFSSIAQIVPKNLDQTKPIQDRLNQLLETTINRGDGETKQSSRRNRNIRE